MFRCAVFALLIAAASAQNAERVLIDTKVKVDGNEWPIQVNSGETNSDVAKKFAIEHKLDQEGMQNVYMFLNQKAAAAGTYKKELGEYMGFEYAGEITPIMVFEDSNAKGIAEFMAVKLGLLAEASVALQADLERFIISKVALRMPMDLTEQGLGLQYIIVRRGESSDEAVKKFASGLKGDFGFTMTDKGIAEITQGVNAKMKELM